MTKEIWVLLTLKDKLLFLLLFVPALVLEISWIIIILLLTIWMYPIIIFRSGDIPSWLIILLALWIDHINSLFYNSFRKKAVKHKAQKEKAVNENGGKV